MSFTASSQSLKPKVRWENKDTLFCFTIPQGKIIAKHLENSRYCDSVLVQTENQVELLNQMQVVKDSSLLIMKMKTENQQSIIDNQDAMIITLNNDFNKADKKFHSERWQKRVLAAGVFLLTVTTILK